MSRRPTSAGIVVTPQAPDYNDPHPDLKSGRGRVRPAIAGTCSTSARCCISPGLGSGIVRVITKDWQVGLIFQARSGSPLTPGDTNDNALTGEPNQRALIVAGVDPYLAEPTWVPNAGRLQHAAAVDQHGRLRERAVGRLRQRRRGMLYGPGFWNADLAFSRNINFGARTPRRTACRGVQSLQSRELGQSRTCRSGMPTPAASPRRSAIRASCSSR